MTVTLHVDYSGKGRSQSFAKTRHDLDTTTIGNNQARSVTLDLDSKVVLFTKTDCRGSVAWLDKSVANLKNTPTGSKEKNFHQKVESILINPVEIPVSVKVITKKGKLPGGYESLEILKRAVDKSIDVQNYVTWEKTLIRFQAVAEIYEISDYPTLFDLEYESSKDIKELRNIQRDLHRMDLYIVNTISSAGGFCSGASKLGKDLGCVITAKNITEWSGRKLSHEFGHHLGLSHRNDLTNNLMKQGVNEHNLLQEQICEMHDTIANKLSDYKLKY